MTQQLLSWTIFGTTILFLLAFDLGILSKRDRVMSFRESFTLSIFYIFIACAFGVYIYYGISIESAKEYFTGFVLEKAMSLDNIFVISIIFKFFAIPPKYQHRVLFWGILGVIVLRGIMISIGSALLIHFEWVLFVFAAILILTGIKTFFISDQKDLNIKDMYVYKFLCKHFNVYPKLENNKFLIAKNNEIYITPLFIALVTIETMDVVFAVDSIPAIFAITNDVFIVYTSNIFAVLGLRALYFCLADIVERFEYLKYSLAVILIFIGVKIFVAHFIKIPTYIPLVVTITLLLAGIIFSIFKHRKLQRNS